MNKVIDFDFNIIKDGYKLYGNNMIVTYKDGKYVDGNNLTYTVDSLPFEEFLITDGTDLDLIAVKTCVINYLIGKYEIDNEVIDKVLSFSEHEFFISSSREGIHTPGFVLDVEGERVVVDIEYYHGIYIIVE